MKEVISEISQSLKRIIANLPKVVKFIEWNNMVMEGRLGGRVITKSINKVNIKE